MYKERIKVLGNVEQVAKCGISKSQSNNNNSINCMNSTLKEIKKILREWKCKSAIAKDGKRTQNLHIYQTTIVLKLGYCIDY
jgi:hypothetical protein